MYLKTIQGVVAHDLQRHCDDRGWLMESWAATRQGMAVQSNVSFSYPGVIRAFHWHENQDDWWVVPKGMIRAVLYDRRPESPTHDNVLEIVMGENRMYGLFIPRGVAHGFQVLGHEPALLVYWVNQLYDPQNPDEKRIPYDDPDIGFDWSVKAR